MIKVVRKATVVDMKSLPKVHNTVRSTNIRFGRVCITSDYDLDGRLRPTF